MKQNSAPGPDNMCIELIKEVLKELDKRLPDMILTMWEKEVLPTE